MQPLVPLPLSLDQLLRGEGVESVRLEFKATYNDVIEQKVIPTICAFANDLQGLGGGYIVIGVAEDEARKGVAVLPPIGLDAGKLDEIQQKIRVRCKEWIEPEYLPRIAPRADGERWLLVLYCPPGDARPYSSKTGGKTERKYWVRVGSETLEAKGDIEKQLHEVSARTSFDDRRRPDVSFDAVSPSLVRNYFRDLGNPLESDERPLDSALVLRGMRLTAGLNGGECPRNAAILFFVEEPETFIPGARIETAQFDEDDVLLEERAFTGPLPSQIREVVNYIETLSATIVEKSATSLQAQRFVTWPGLALREAIVNAVYHRGYHTPALPTRIKLFPDRVEITSYPGPVPGLRPEHLAPGASPPGFPPRNPRVGELLKALRLAETWQTGIPLIRREMDRNGSGVPLFDFDDARSYFRVTLPAHPEYVALQTVQRAALLWVKGERDLALERVQAAFMRQPGSSALALTAVQYAAELGRFDDVRRVYDAYKSSGARLDRRVSMRWARALFDLGEDQEATRVLSDLQPSSDVREVVEQARLLKRGGMLERAHRFYASVEGEFGDDPRVLGEFAAVKRALAGTARGANKSTTQRALNREAEALLRRIIKMSGSTPNQKGWAWFHLAQVLQFTEPRRRADVDEAVRMASSFAAQDPQLASAVEAFVAARR